MNKKVLLLVVLGCISLVAYSQDTPKIESVWEYWNTPATGGNPYFPFMIPKSGEANGEGCGGPVPGYENTFFDMDIVSSLVRYDEDRLLLFVVENGINEENPDHDAAMAAQYPDRTLWWIDARDGSPMGIALQPLKLGGGGTTFSRGGTTYTTLDFWPTSDFFVNQSLNDSASSFRADLMQEVAPKCEVDAEGNLYITDRHMLVRYTPDGKGGFNAPTLCFEYQKVNPPVLPDGTVVQQNHYRSWSMKDVHIVGKGANKVMTTTGRHWLDGAGVMYYSSSDGGASWVQTSYKGQGTGVVGTGGGCSAPYVSEVYNDEYVFACGFPGSSDNLYRMSRANLGNPYDPFVQDGSDFWNYNAQDLDDSKSQTMRYMSWQKADCATVEGVPYVAVLTIPKWKSLYEDWTADGGAPSAWVALISMDDQDGDAIEGDVVATYQIAFRDEDEPNIPGADFDEDGGAAWQNIYQV